MSLQLIGYWIESLWDNKYFPPQEFVGDMLERALIAHYLQNGQVYEVYRGFSWCRFGCRINCGHKELTDGQWVWPEGLAHYVLEHGIMLPHLFIEHVLAGGSRAEDAGTLPPEPQDDFWREWCAGHSSRRLQDRLAAARVKAEAMSHAILEEHARQVEAYRGLSDKRCMWKGCEHFALKDSVFCAHCLQRNSPVSADIEVRYRLLHEVLKPVSCLS